MIHHVHHGTVHLQIFRTLLVWHIYLYNVQTFAAQQSSVWFKEHEQIVILLFWQSRYCTVNIICKLASSYSKL